MEYGAVEHNVSDKAELKAALEAAVKRQLMCDVPYGVLLSGGLDSSVISAITKLYAARRVEDDGKSEAWWPQLHSFAVGLEGSPDPPPPAKWLITSAPSTTRSTSPCRKDWMPCGRHLSPRDL